MKLFQKRFKPRKCDPLDKLSSKFYSMNDENITCYDKDESQLTGKSAPYFEFNHTGFKAHPNGEEVDTSVKGKAFKISGRKFSTFHAYYVEMNARNLEESK